MAKQTIYYFEKEGFLQFWNKIKEKISKVENKIPEASDSSPSLNSTDSTGNPGASETYSRGDHRHPKQSILLKDVTQFFYKDKTTEKIEITNTLSNDNCVQLETNLLLYDTDTIDEKITKLQNNIENETFNINNTNNTITFKEGSNELTLSKNNDGIKTIDIDSNGGAIYTNDSNYNIALTYNKDTGLSLTENIVSKDYVDSKIKNISFSSVENVSIDNLFTTDLFYTNIKNTSYDFTKIESLFNKKGVEI